MSLSMSTFASRYLRVAGAGMATVMAAVALGYFPTLRFGGVASIPGMFAGCAISLLASWVGAVPLCRLPDNGAARVNGMLAGMAIRVFVTALLALPVALMGWFEIKSLLLWVAISYMLTLAVETAIFVRWLGEPPADAGRNLR